MDYNRYCNSFLDENFEHFVIAYRGAFKEQIMENLFLKNEYYIMEGGDLKCH